MTTGNDLARALVPVLRTLRDLEIPHYVGGSVASSIQGVVRSTLDVDLVVDMRPDHTGPFVAALAVDFYASREMVNEAVRERDCFNVVHYSSMTKIDVYLAGTRPFDLGVWARLGSVPLPFAPDLALPLLSPEDVVLTKLEWFVSGGRVSERQLGDVRGVLTIWGESLDLAYLSKWAPVLGVENDLRPLLAERP